MDRAKTNPFEPAVECEKHSKKRSILIPGGLLAALVGVCLLWIRFGDGVFAASLIDGFIACF